jgi:apolipoprotein N-acyltransferase
MKNFLKIITLILTPILSGVLLYASFPPFDIGFLAWVSLVPLLTLLSFARYRQAFFISFLTGIVLCGLHGWWLNVVPGLPFIAFWALVLYCAIFFGLFGFFLAFVVCQTKLPKILVAPALWVSIEFFRSNLSFLSLPWALLGYSQHNNIPVIQIASFTSVYGVSFLIVLVNAATSEGILRVLNNAEVGTALKNPMGYKILERAQDDKGMLFIQSKRTSLLRSIPLIAGAFITVLIVYLWGAYQVKTLGSNTEGLLTASLIQGNIPQDVKWDGNFRKMIMQKYHSMTLQASLQNPDLIIWPESSTPGYLMHDYLTHRTVMDVLHETGIPLLLGSSSQAKIGRGERSIFKSLNSAFLLDGKGRILSSYNKIKLLPFGEYLPLKGKFPWPQWLVPSSGDFIPGRNPVVFRLPQGNFGVVICWENLFPEVFRIFVERGGQFMVNLTNEAWFGKSAASHQIIAMSVFRAVENRVSLLRCANTGVTCLIDPLGRVEKKVVDEQGNDIMVSGILTTSVPKPQGPTFYTKYGDIFAIACTVSAFFFVLSALLPLKLRQLLKISGKS